MGEVFQIQLFMVITVHNSFLIHTFEIWTFGQREMIFKNIIWLNFGIGIFFKKLKSITKFTLVQTVANLEAVDQKRNCTVRPTKVG